MSWHVVSDVYKAKLGSPTRKAIAAKLADWADDDGGSIFPSVQRIAEETETSVRTVQYVLKAFVAEGLLVVVDRGGKGPGNTTEYRLDLERLSGLPRTRTPDPAKGSAKGAKAAPLARRLRVQLTAKKGAPVAPDSSRTFTKKADTSFFEKKRQPSGAPRDTSEPFPEYAARMIREGKWQGDSR